jgi:hypothetical protein
MEAGEPEPPKKNNRCRQKTNKPKPAPKKTLLSLVKILGKRLSRRTEQLGKNHLNPAKQHRETVVPLQCCP